MDSQFWHSNAKAREVNEKIGRYQRLISHRPTVINIITDHMGRVLVVRHLHDELDLGFIQGEIEPTDAHPLAAGLREGWEESQTTEDMIAEMRPYLGEQTLPTPKPKYPEGSFYVFVGLKLKEGCDISLEPAPGHPKALLERIWCENSDAAIKLLRTQPGARPTHDIVHKVERVLIPALRSLYLPSPQGFSEMLDALK